MTKGTRDSLLAMLVTIVTALVGGWAAMLFTGSTAIADGPFFIGALIGGKIGFIGWAVVYTLGWVIPLLNRIFQD